MSSSSNTTAQKVIELSVQETNKLRAEIGLPPLRVKSSSDAETRQSHDDDVAAAASSSSERGVLELSVDESNQLRAQLGLPALRTTSSSQQQQQSVIIHAPAENVGAQTEAAERLERARLQRQVQQGIKTTFAHRSLADDNEETTATTASTWAQQMRSQKAAATTKTTTTTTTTKQPSQQQQQQYDEQDLKGLHVAHAVTELQEGSTTVLTLKDSSLLLQDKDGDDNDNDNDQDKVQLENVNLAERRQQQLGLKEKRKMELGLGRAGGYAGFDDDEFEELGGVVVVVAASGSSQAAATAGGPGKAKRARRGFEIGGVSSHLEEEDEQEGSSDLFAKAISLEPAKADVVASDFMTVEEDDEETRKTKKKKKKKKKKDLKLFNNKKKRKDKKKKRRKLESDDDDEEVEEEDQVKVHLPTKGLLEELEETAVENTAAVSSRKRRRSEEDVTAADATKQEEEEEEESSHLLLDQDIDQRKTEKRAKFDAIMAKGNERTRQAFAKPTKAAAAATAGLDLDEEPDDAFLNAALAKARRLNRLKEMSSKKQRVRGADAVLEAVQSSQQQQQQQKQPDETTSSSGTVSFSVDETREFTRALRARAEQTERVQAKKAIKKEEEEEGEAVVSNMDIDKPSVPSAIKEEEQEPVEEEADLTELAKQVKEEEDVEGETAALEGATGTAVAMGRGLGGVLTMLRQTGEMSHRAGKGEEMRGRAKDKRTYEDYKALNLSQVVRIDERTATEKDKELAHREVKLEYRDKHGRLLTRKEAFRDLSYQFHGYGSGKRKEEKKKAQIAREQAEARLASRQATEGAGAGTFGALKATQKATGKAFVVHKT